MPPAFHRRGVDRLAHLRDAGGADRAFGVVEIQAGVIPFQAAIRDQAARLCFLIGYDVLVPHVEENTGRQHLAPMFHQARIVGVILPQLRQVVSVFLLAVEQAGKA